MKHSLLLFFSAVFSLLFSSCYYDNFKELRPQGAIPTPCDSLGVMSFSAQIVPVLTANCTQSCHNPNATPGNGNRDLTDPLMIQDAALNNGFTPGDGGPLYGTMSHDPNYGNDMPKNGSKVSDCDLAKIRKWATSGAPINN